jgi:CRP/FNR family cyclic AMP-dependent transcriptional regulator
MDAQCDVVELMRGVPALASADASVLRELEALARVVTVPPGTVLFSEGDHHPELYFVSSGTITLDMLTAQCGKQQIITVGEGDLIAWSALLGDGRMTASAIASQESRLIAFPADQLLALCEANRDVGYVVMLCIAKLISRRLLATRLQLLDLFHG